MKYHSRSPQEWKKIDEEKLKMNRTNELRRRSLIFLFMNFVLVISVIFVVKIYNIVNPAVKGAAGPLRMVVSLKDTLVEGEILDVKVKLINTSKSKISFTIRNFKFVVEDESGNVIYDFDHPDEVSAQMGGLSSVLLFDLKRETEISDLKPGKYLVKVAASINDKNVQVVRNFEVVVELSIGLGDFQPFLFVGETLDLNVSIFNDSLKPVEVNVGEVEIVLKKEEERINDLKRRISKSYKLDPGEGTLLLRYRPSVLFNLPGIYTLKIDVETDRGRISDDRSFAVITQDQTSVRSLRFYIESPISVPVGESFDVKISLYNDSKENRYVLAKEFIATLGNGESIFSKRIENFRIWIPPYSMVTIYEAKGISIQNPGIYKLVVLLKTPNGNISKQMEIRAGGV